MKKSWTIVAIALIFAAGFAARFYRIGAHDLWFDEVASVKYAQNPWFNWNAPLYWIILRTWTMLFGFSETALRLPSAIFSFLAVILTYAIGKKIFDRKTAVLAAVFICFSPFQLWYAQEARGYSLAMLLGVLSSLLLLKSREEKGYASYLLFIITSLAGLYTDYFYIFLFAAQCLFVLFFTRPRLTLKAILPFFIGAAGFIPYTHRFVGKLCVVAGGFWLQAPTPRSLLTTFENFMLGYNVRPGVYFFFDVLLAGFFVFAATRTMRPGSDKKAVFCAALLLSVLFVFAFSTIVFPIYLDRGLIIFSPFFYMLFAHFIASLRRKWLKSICLAAILLLLARSVTAFYQDEMYQGRDYLAHHAGTYIKKPFRPIVKFLEDNLEPGDIVGVTSASPPIIPSLSFYSSGKLAPYYFFSPGQLDTNWNRLVVSNGSRIPAYKIGTLAFKRLWIISCDVGMRTGGLDPNSVFIKEFLEKKYKLDMSREFDGLWLFRYSK